MFGWAGNGPGNGPTTRCGKNPGLCEICVRLSPLVGEGDAAAAGAVPRKSEATATKTVATFSPVSFSPSPLPSSSMSRARISGGRCAAAAAVAVAGKIDEVVSPLTPTLLLILLLR
ncbi:Os05g0148251 [Oryza sativa Japonica Group]|uniref:Os05g0148251 protein n=1 Tax=Oryza sativa subsp. japonica TaxID=39947 RepID=A0A0P0WHX5_ORYSJ|nr:hypothetical protein DAI22_05g035650 [Oryza sativa Japonica Group]BAS92270.1 Os05g0148251 [Oryza sativa Japonica Group]